MSASAELPDAPVPDPVPVRVVVDRVTKEFTRTGGTTVRALDDVTLSVRENEITVLLGPSGCGKSTLLRSIAGLENPTEGSIKIGGQTVFDGSTGMVTPPEKRDVSMMFQSYALWPHMTLEANVGYPLRVRGVSRSAARARAREYLDLVGLAGLGQQYAGSISGGQAQRAALARTLIAEPAVVLFDEPLSNVDAKVRTRLRGELLRIHRELRFSAVYVTHDQIEAMGVAHQIALMRDGRILQVGDPESIYERPETRYTGEFIGEANFIEGEVIGKTQSALQVRTPLGEVSVARVELEHDVGRQVTLMIRPERVLMRRQGDGKANLVGIVDSSLYSGSRTEYSCMAGNQLIQVWQMAGSEHFSVGDGVALEFPPSALRIVAD